MPRLVYAVMYVCVLASQPETARTPFYYHFLCTCCLPFGSETSVWVYDTVRVQDMARLDRDMHLQVMLDGLEVFDPRVEDQQDGSERACETSFLLADTVDAPRPVLPE